LVREQMVMFGDKRVNGVLELFAHEEFGRLAQNVLFVRVAFLFVVLLFLLGLAFHYPIMIFVPDI